MYLYKIKILGKVHKPVFPPESMPMQGTVVNPAKKLDIKKFRANSKLFRLKIDLPHEVCLTSSAKLEGESTKNVSVICVGKVSDQVSASLKLK